MVVSSASPLTPSPAAHNGERRRWGRLHGSAFGLAIGNAARHHSGMLLLVTADAPSASRIENELRFYLAGDENVAVLGFPDWETLPYDLFSPYQDIISERLATLYRLPTLQRGILIVPVTTLMHRIAPRDYIGGNVLLLDVGRRLLMEQMRLQLERSGYACVSQVMGHGEFAVRGSLIDLFPMGSALPYRIELFDDEVESIRTFDPESQRTLDKVEQIRLLPAREYPFNDEAIKLFRENYRLHIEGDPQKSVIYRDITKGGTPPGIEYYLPLFFKETATLFDYLPQNTLLFTTEGVNEAAEHFRIEYQERYETAKFNLDHPPLPPAKLFLEVPELFSRFKQLPRTQLHHTELPEENDVTNFATESPPALTLDSRAEQPAAALQRYVTEFGGRILFSAESAGRREALLETLRNIQLQPQPVESWAQFLDSTAPLGLVVAPLEQGLCLIEPRIAVIAEPQLYGEQVMQRRRRQKGRSKDLDAVIRNLAELQPGAPVVHEDHGVGRYLGLQKLNVGEIEAEFLTLEYAGGDKLYVPVSSLHLISRYSGASPEHTPLHKLGSGAWEKAKRKASEKARDVAAELLDIYARRAARQGFAYALDAAQYHAFAAGFPFEETPDQQDAIDAVIADMVRKQPMDRLICGDVGFGKTEVAMRAAFKAIDAGYQVAVLVPTTILAEQHRRTFTQRMAEFPFKIAAVSRFCTAKEE
ncbi:MAG TPA: CarD family transcriptional regulator, partial [Gammaproteobacteria bacterium]